MSRRHFFMSIGALASALFGVAGCAVRTAPAVALPVTASALSASDGSVLCDGLADRFIGLPAISPPEQDLKAPLARPVPLAGRWWLRGCSVERNGSRILVKLSGPGWYSLNEHRAGLAVHQQVPFELYVELAGRVAGTEESGVFSVWIEPEREPLVVMKTKGPVKVATTSAWGGLVRSLPFASVEERAEAGFTAEASAALQRELRSGATATYDLRSRQGDATLGRLPAGQAPPRAFQDGIPWLVNERLQLDGSTVHVVGPITPGPTRLDVDLESGDGITYRAICAHDMSASYGAIVAADLSALPPERVVAARSVASRGRQSTDFHVPSCKFYVVFSALTPVATLASIRIRA